MANFTIVGAGLAGSLLAIYLAKQGHEVAVFEKRGDMRQQTVERGRSINMALSTRGLAALAEVGMESEILAKAIPLKGRMIHDRDGSQALQPYSIHKDEVIYSISRNGLNMALLDRAEMYPAVTLAFEHRCLGLDLAEGIAEFDDAAAGEVVSSLPGVVIGADGAFSAVRAQLQRLDRFDYHQDYLDWGYKELTMPALPGGGFALEKHALHIWPRQEFMLIALPNLDGSFTCTVFLPFEGTSGFAGLAQPAAISAFFAAQFPDAVPLLPDLEIDFIHNPVSSLVYVKCFPWHHDATVALIGDACHAVVPFYGQGMNAAFEDCSVLAACLTGGGDLEGVFRKYEALRKPNTDALAELALENFVEMRDRVAQRGYKLRNRVDKVLHRLFPRSWIPLYSLVTFSRVPYAEALARARRQDRELAGFLGGAGSLLIAGLIWLVLVYLYH